MHRWLIPTFLILASAMSAPGAYSQEAQTELAGLENRFFEHTYQNNDEETRVDRLEKLVFGESKDGNLDKRIADLKGATDTALDGLPEQAAAPPPVNATTALNDKGKSTEADSSANYPKINELESLVFGEEYPRLKVSLRIGQLENKVFGKISTSNDLSQRTQDLELYWQKNLSPARLKEYDNTVSWLESQVMGQTYPERPLLERIQTLEGIIFPQERVEAKANVSELINTMANAVNLHRNSNNNNIIALNQNRDSGTAANYNYSDSALPQNQAYPSGNATQRGAALYQHTNYPLQAAGNQYRSAYSQPTGYYNSATTSNLNSNAPVAVGYQPGYSTPAGQLVNNSQQTQEAPKGHPLLKGLAKALGAAAGMAAGAIMSSSMYSGGYGGYGGYMPGYGYPAGGPMFNYP